MINSIKQKLKSIVITVEVCKEYTGKHIQYRRDVSSHVRLLEGSLSETKTIFSLTADMMTVICVQGRSPAK